LSNWAAFNFCQTLSGWLYDGICVGVELFSEKGFVLFIAFSKRSCWAEMECHLSLLEQRKIDRAKNDQSFTSFEYKNPNKILKTLKAKISGRAMIQVASTIPCFLLFLSADSVGRVELISTSTITHTQNTKHAR
jgi:hypothetical protein